MRSISESANSMMKRKMPAKIRKRFSHRKMTEESLKTNMHNLRHTDTDIIKDYRELSLK